MYQAAEDLGSYSIKAQRHVFLNYSAEWLGLTSMKVCLRKQCIRVSQSSLCLRPADSSAEMTRNQGPYTPFLTSDVPTLPTHICI